MPVWLDGASEPPCTMTVETPRSNERTSTQRPRSLQHPACRQHSHPLSAPTVSLRSSHVYDGEAGHSGFGQYSPAEGRLRCWQPKYKCSCVLTECTWGV